ncbi:hypothetical protein C5167_038713 [Papaver somniferum]|uniref:Uncharacterized protein n=1 Tax=Papaver somniferum TaxID=3469 RepID=A0A4Y7ICM0_PAPSO|nr:hypothetical protein C5167_038713 [Papaver somniferum]
MANPNRNQHQFQSNMPKEQTKWHLKSISHHSRVTSYMPSYPKILSENLINRLERVDFESSLVHRAEMPLLLRGLV